MPAPIELHSDMDLAVDGAYRGGQLSRQGEVDTANAQRDAAEKKYDDHMATHQAPVSPAGRSSSNWDHGVLTTSGVVRLYRFGTVDPEVAASGAKVIFLTDEAANPSPGLLETYLRSIFNRLPELEQLWWMRDNEITAAQLTPAQADAYVAKVKADKAVIDKFPKAFMAINTTAYGIRVGRHNVLKGCAPHLDGIISSSYNPGRENTPPVWDPYAQYMGPILDVVEQWSILAGRKLSFGVGECGAPVDPSDPAKRPAYFAGLRKYVRDECARRGIPAIGDCYWDNQKSGGPDNRLQNDNARGNGSTAFFWKNG